MTKTLQELQDEKEAPMWMKSEGYDTISRGYLLPNETPKDMYHRIASTAALYYGKKDYNYWYSKFFDAMWKNWLCPASPILSNMGTDRGLSISCNSLHISDSVDSIFNKSHELAMLSKNGAGVGIYVGDIRGRGTPIAGNGTSEGVVPWLRLYDTTTHAVSQGSTRRGASAVYLPIDHPDIEEFINIRRPVGDPNRRCLNLHHGVCLTDKFMQDVESKVPYAKHLWTELLRCRFESGEPFFFFSDNVNRQNPETYKKLNLEVKTSNICVTGDQKVITSQGIKTVLDLFESQEELTLFDGTKEVKASPMYLVEENAEVWQITTEEGRTHKLTPYHQILTEKGMMACEKLSVGQRVAVQRNEGLFGTVHHPQQALFLGTHHGHSNNAQCAVIPSWVWMGTKLTQSKYLLGLLGVNVSTRTEFDFSELTSRSGYILPECFARDVQILLDNLGAVETLDEFDKIKSIEVIEKQNVYCTKVDSKEHLWVCNSFITSNCNEIYLHTDPDHTFVCCLSSLNLMKWNEWKDTDLVETAIYFLDAVMEEYIRKAATKIGFEPAVRFATKSRALGLGVLGWHSLLQSNMLPFDSFDAMMLNAKIFSTMRQKADIATQELAKLFGEPEWCKGSGRRNTHTIAVAPTVSNALISGGYSQGIEPLISNVYAQKTAKGTFIRKNPQLEQLLEEKGQNTIEVWKQINADGGSVANLGILSEKEKEVFLTAQELNQHAIIKQAAQRQKYIDQGQSLNLFFGVNSDPKYIHEVHMEAWRQGLKGLYYCRSESVLRGDNVFRQKDECKACEG